MKERTALILAIGGGGAVALLVLSVLALLGASSQLRLLAYFVILGIGADTAARVALHYRR